MTAYLIEVDDTKQGVMYSTVIGPFRDATEAEEFRDELGMGEQAQRSGEGGYSACHVVCDETVDYSPGKYREEHDGVWDEDDDDAEAV